MISYIAKYFTLNRRERNGILALISLLFAMVIVKFFVVYHYPTKTENVLLVELDSVAAKLAVQNMLSASNGYPDENYKGSGTYNSKRKKDSLFYFDPNTVSFEQALRLGFNKGCAQMLINYRNKGAKFYKPADLEKLYCMEKPFFTKLEPYIIIEGSKKENQKPAYSEHKKENKQVSIEINSADSVEWMSLYGIGPGYTRRILKYRSILGGFTSVEQIAEVYNLPDSVYQSIKPHLTVNAELVQKLKVNVVDFKTMVHHPYIKYEGTKCIFALKRNKNIKEEDLVNSSCFSREHLKKVLPYLDFTP